MRRHAPPIGSTPPGGCVGWSLVVAGVTSLMAAALGPGPLRAEDRPLPTRATVGPAAMPEAIEPIAPPFEMPQPRRPQFAPHVRDITADLEAAGPGPVTGLIQEAIDATAAGGGGRVVIARGTWNTGRLRLRSGVNLHLATGVVLRFSGEIGDYLPMVETWYEGVPVMTAGGLVYAHGQTGVAVTGGGTLIGPAAGPLREGRPGLVENLFDPATPVAERICDGQSGRPFLRPNFLVFVGCRQVLVEGITLRNGPMWHLAPIDCEEVIIRGVTIESRGVGNGDGIDIVACRNVLVEYCRADTGDDAYAVKAGRSAALSPPGTETRNVVIRRNLATGGTGGIACGSETAGGIRQVHVHDCVFAGVKPVGSALTADAPSSCSKRIRHRPKGSTERNQADKPGQRTPSPEAPFVIGHPNRRPC